MHDHRVCIRPTCHSCGCTYTESATCCMAANACVCVIAEVGAFKRPPPTRPAVAGAHEKCIKCTKFALRRIYVFSYAPSAVLLNSGGWWWCWLVGANWHKRMFSASRGRVHVQMCGRAEQFSVERADEQTPDSIWPVSSRFPIFNCQQYANHTLYIYI